MLRRDACVLAAGVLLALSVTSRARGAPDPVHEWVLDARAVSERDLAPSVGDLAGRLDAAPVLGSNPPHVDFGGANRLEVLPKGVLSALPRSAITIEAWAALRTTSDWGAVVGHLQDNGGFEKGWALGNRGRRFTFGLSTAGADDGDGLMTYLDAETPFRLRRWHHVVGAYDGAEMRLYVDAALAATSDAQSGPIAQADSWLAIGAYQDDNELYLLDGAVHSVRLYDRALSDAEVRERYEAGRGLFENAPPLPNPPKSLPPLLIDGPWAAFADQDSATIRWSTDEAAPTVLEFGLGDSLERIADPALTREHAVTVPGLARDTEYAYRVLMPGPNGELATPTYPLDTEFDYTAPRLPDAGPHPPEDAEADLWAGAAQAILERTGVTGGYCIDLGCGDGRLGLEIARRSDLRVVGVSTDRAAVARGRNALREAGLYGTRVTLRCVESLSSLPFPDYTANLVVSSELLRGEGLPAEPSLLERLLRPQGGQAMLGVSGRASADAREELGAWMGGKADVVEEGGVAWARMTRGEPLPGAGEWTHAYGDAGQTANSHDELLRGEAGKTIEVQWFGLPGPNALVDRLARKIGPLSTAGRVFTFGNDRIIAQDAYNGSILWSVEIPGMLRNNIPRDSGNAAATEERLYLAVRDHCWAFNTATGARVASYDVRPDRADESCDWGLVAAVDGRLYGTSVARGGIHTEFRGPRYWWDGKSGEDILNVCADDLFALDPDTGERLWTYEGLILGSTIVIGDGRVCFLESRAPEALESPDRRLGDELWTDAWIVSLDAGAGRKLWEKPLGRSVTPIVTYTVLRDGQLALVRSFDGGYHVAAYAAEDGAERWTAEHAWKSDNHGHHIQHPVLADGRFFLEPRVYDWVTGAPIDVEFPGRSKCGTMTAAEFLLHYRDYNSEVWDLETNTITEFNRLRTNCWLGLISGGGLLMATESGAGCSCNWPIYTSLTYRTKDDY